jgi:hypothetical protein
MSIRSSFPHGLLIASDAASSVNRSAREAVALLDETLLRLNPFVLEVSCSVEEDGREDVAGITA